MMSIFTMKNIKTKLQKFRTCTKRQNTHVYCINLCVITTMILKLHHKSNFLGDLHI